MGNILNRSNLLKKSEKTATEPQSPPLNDREDAIRALITRMYMSCRKDAPSPEILDYEVQIAMEDLKEVPDSMLKSSFATALADAGGFLPGNGQIIAAYRKERGDRHESAAKAIRDENTRRYLSAPVIQRTPEEIAEIEEMCRKTREFLK